MENPIKMDDLGVALFSETSMYISQTWINSKKGLLAGLFRDVTLQGGLFLLVTIGIITPVAGAITTVKPLIFGQEIGAR